MEDEDAIKIINDIKSKITALESQVNTYKKALKVLEEELRLRKSGQMYLYDIFQEFQAEPKEKRKTFRSKIEGLLSDYGIPMTSREIMDQLNYEYKTNFTLYNFSGRFSQTYRSKASNIRKFQFADLPIDVRTVYGLKNWFIGDDMKPEYIDKYLRELNL